MNLTLEEREPIVTFNEKDDTAEWFTYNGKPPLPPCWISAKPMTELRLHYWEVTDHD